jgi:hypothetical protein
MADYPGLVSTRWRIRSDAVRSCRSSAGVRASITSSRTLATWAGALAVSRRSPARVKIALVYRPSFGSGSRRTSWRSSRRLIRCHQRIYQHSLKLEDARAIAAYGQHSSVGKILEIHQELPGRIHIVLIRQVVGF